MSDLPIKVPSIYYISIMPSLSVIIPTHKRAKILGQCLDHLARQTIADQLEIIVVSDGHDTATAKLFEKKTTRKKREWEDMVTFDEIEKSQQGTARNAGVKKATAPLCLFISDDIFLAADACEQHVKAHESFDEQSLSMHHAVLGFTAWDPDIELTPVMKYLDQSGWQFGYSSIAHYAHENIPERVQHLYTYASHVSLPTELARQYPFREDIQLYGWEDTEWGMRLKSADVRLHYEPEAKAYHHHQLTLSESLERMENIGEAAVRMQALIPGFDRVPKGLKLLLYYISALFPTMAGRHRAAFLRGMRRVK